MTTDRTTTTRDRLVAQLNTIVANAVCWQRGVGSEWQCDAIIDSDVLEALVDALSDLPNHKIEVVISKLVYRTAP